MSIAPVLFMALNSYGATGNEVAINQVVQAVFESKKSALVQSINKRLKQKNFHRGIFFKGEVPQLGKVADELSQFNPRVVESSKGFTIIAGKGKYKIKTEMAFVDIMAGKIKIAGKNVQLKGDMSYLEVLRAIAPPIAEPLLKKLKSQKTSFSTPLDFFISKAWAQEEQDDDKVILEGKDSKIVLDREITAEISAAGYVMANLLLTFVGKYSLDSLAVIATATASTITKGILLGYGVIVAGVAAAAVASDISATEVYRFISHSDDKAIDQVRKDLKDILQTCQDRRGQYYDQDGQGNMILQVEKVMGLSSHDLQYFQEFQDVWQMVQQIGTYADKAPSRHKKLRKSRRRALACSGFTKKSSAGHLVYSRYFQIPNPVSATHLLPLCKDYRKIVECFATAPGPFGEGLAKKDSIHGKSRQEGSKLLKFSNSLKSAYEGSGVLSP